MSLFLPFLATIVLAAACAAAPVDILVCALTHKEITSSAATAVFAAGHYYSGRYPNLRIRTAIVGDGATASALGSPARGIAAGIAHNQTYTDNCTVSVGPGWSSIAQAVNLLVNSLWIDFASSTTLSDKTVFTYFNRLIPSDAAGAVGMVQGMKHFKWALVNTICADTAYGVSVVGGVATAAKAQGVEIGLARCFPAHPDAAAAVALDNFLDTLKTSAESKIVAVGMVNGDPLFPLLVDRVIAKGLDREFIFLFAEGVCGGTDGVWTKLHGAFCVNSLMNTTRAAAFNAAFRTRLDKAYVDRQLITAGVAAADVTPNTHNMTILDAFLSDAAHFGIAATSAFIASDPSARPGQLDFVPRLVAYARANVVVPDGLTGRLDVDAKGERETANFAWYNAQPSLGAAAGSKSSSELVMSVSGAEVVVLKQIYFPGLGLSNTAPSHLMPKAGQEAAATDNTLAIGVGAVLGAVLILVAVGSGVYFFVRAARRGRCPRDPSEPFAAFFVSVKNEAAIHDAYEADAHVHFDRLRDRVSAAASAEGCHVARRLDAHFLVVAKTSAQALRCAARVIEHYRYAEASADHSIRVMRRGVHDSSGSTFSRAASATGTETATASPPPRDSNSSPKPDHNSNVKLCVAIGVFFGKGRIADTDEEHPVYSGAIVDRAAAMTDMARAGQILAVRDAVDIADKSGALPGRVLPWVPLKATASCPAMDTFVFEPKGMPEVFYEKPVTGPSDEASDDHAMVGALTAALESAGSGVSSRTIAVAALVIPALRSRALPASSLGKIAASITATAKANKGALVSIQDGTAIVAVNHAGAPVTQPTSRAAAIALDSVHALSTEILPALAEVALLSKNSAPLCADVFAAVDTAVAVSGNLEAGVAISAAPIVSRATMLAVSLERRAALVTRNDAGAADDDGTPCRLAASAAAFQEIQTTFLLMACDLFAVPSKGTAHGHARKNSVSDQTIGPVAAARIQLSYSLIGEAPEASDDEWMYQLQQDTRNPFAAVNGVATQLATAASSDGLDAAVHDAAMKVSEAAAGDPGSARSGQSNGRRGSSVLPVRGLVKLRQLLATVEGCDGGSFPEKVMAYAVRNANTATQAFPVAPDLAPQVLTPVEAVVHAPVRGDQEGL